MKPCSQKVIDITNPNTQQVLNDMDPTKLIDTGFLSIIELLTVNKFDDIGSCRQFGKICWLLKYPFEY